MRIRRLDLIAFGPFTDVSLDFSAGNPGLHVILGPNEAGKSSTLRALRAWLFGIEARSPDNFLHDHKQMRVGGVLETAAGQQLSCIRRKGNKDTLLDQDGKTPIAADSLSPFLGGLDEKLFTELHAIDYQTLIAGGEAILDQKGDLGSMLFGAAVGGQVKANLLNVLNEEADQLFRPRAQKAIINNAVAELKQARKLEREQMVSVKDWKDLQKQLRDVESTIAAIEQQISEAAGTRSRLVRFRRVCTSLAERRDLMDSLADLGDQRLLAQDLASRRRSTLDSRQKASEDLEKAAAKRERLLQQAQALTVPPGLLEHREAIEELQQQLGAIRQSLAHVPDLNALRLQHRAEATESLKAIRPDLGAEDVDQLRPLLNRHALITSLAQDASGLSARQRQQEMLERRLAERQSKLSAELETCRVPSGDGEALRSLIQAARKAGDLASMRLQALAAANRQEQHCGRELARLGRFEGTLDDLVRLSLPERAALDRYEAAFAELDQEERDLRRQIDDTAGALEQDNQSLRHLCGIEEVPSLESLQAARLHRERGWRLIRAHYVEGTAVDPASEDYGDNPDLPRAYEAAVLSADTIADRLRLDAQRVQELAALQSRIQSLQEKRTLQEEKVRAQAECRSSLQSAWEGIWSGIARPVGSPKEMAEWRQGVIQLLDKAAQLDQANAELNRIMELERSHRTALAAGITTFEQAGEGAGELELEALLSRCERLVRDQDDAQKRRQERLNAQLLLQNDQVAAAEVRSQLDADQQRWQTTWAGAVEGLGLGSTPLPDLALATMERLKSLFDALRQVDEADRRLRAIQQEEERFRASVAGLSSSIALEISEPDPFEAAREIGQRLAKALADDASLRNLRDQISELEEEIAESRQNQQLADRSLAALLREAAVDSDEALTAAIDRSDRRRDLQSAVASLDRQLLEAGDGHSLEELEQEALLCDGDLVDEQLQQLLQDLEELNQQRDDQRDLRKLLSVRQQQLDGSSKAAEAAALAEQLLGQIVPDAEQYLRLTIARLILEEQMERYRRENQTPVLRRAAELFRTLTLGSFEGLRDELDEDNRPYLLGVRSDGSEVPVTGMSEGSRDQLYLALRLATMELERQGQDSLPLVVDDILVGFDDQRTAACLEVLAQFASTTQVLVFSHHGMVAAAARALGRERGVFVHDLLSRPR